MKWTVSLPRGGCSCGRRDRQGAKLQTIVANGSKSYGEQESRMRGIRDRLGVVLLLYIGSQVTFEQSMKEPRE